MAAVTFDGQGFTVDSRRVWLVSGAFHYCRVPRALWRDRLRAMRQAGLNCVLVPVMWNVHEPQPGVFRFEDETDLRALVKMIADESMWCVLRPGPYVNTGWDMGGLPPWLLAGDRDEPMRLRQDDPRFMQAVARYFEAVMDQVRELQVTHAKPGPIILTQVEHEWVCGNDDQAESYLGQLVRFLRESGCNVPLINTNNLWQQAAGTIDGWIGQDHLLTNCRQLRVIRPDAPAIVASLPTGDMPVWGHPCRRKITAEGMQRVMAEASGAGAMVNLDPFCGGTNFGFRGGRLLGGDDRFVATGFDCDGPISETGARTEKYTAAKRICTFLSQFHDLFAHLQPADHHAVAATGLCVVQQTGTQGKVVFIIRDEADATREVEIATPDGRSLPVTLGEERVAWLVLGASLGNVARLDMTNLRPWAFIAKKMLVLFGPAGSPGVLSIDGTLHSFTVPAVGSQEPLIFKDDELTIAVLTTEQADASIIDHNRLYIGCDGVSSNGDPAALKGWPHCAVVDATGAVRRIKTTALPRLAPPKTGKWDAVSLADYASGKAPRFATLSGPKSLEACGADYGYGWYRLRLKRKKAAKVSLMLPNSGDRVHVYTGGELRGIVGVGAEASLEPLDLQLPAGETDVVFLADNLGRFSEGMALDQPKGVYGPVLDVKPMKLGKPAVTSEPRVDVFALSGFVPRSTLDDRGPYPRWTWSVNLTTKEPLVLVIAGHRPRSVVMLNGKPVGIDIDHHVTTTILLSDVRKGVNKITLAQIDAPGERTTDLGKCCTLHQATEVLSEGAGWWYAKWQAPGKEAFNGTAKTGGTGGAPAFFRTGFTVEAIDRPLLAQISGATKGQVYLNGWNVGRYFVAGPGGKKVGPQVDYYLPEPWLKVGENELVLFDEHGRAPTVKLAY